MSVILLKPTPAWTISILNPSRGLQGKQWKLQFQAKYADINPQEAPRTRKGPKSEPTEIQMDPTKLPRGHQDNQQTAKWPN